MSTTIDTLQIEIQSSANNAVKGIDALAESLGRLKTNGGFKTAVNNLNNLRKSLHAFVNIPSSASKIASLAQSLERLKNTKFNNTVSKNLAGLAESLKVVQSVNLTGFDSQIRAVASALEPLGRVKSGGVGTMVKGLKDLDKVTDTLSPGNIKRFKERVDELVAAVTPLSEKMTTVKAGFSGINNASKSLNVSLSNTKNLINVGTLNFSTMTNAVQKFKAACDKVATLFKKLIRDASEWEGISNRFGRGFGNSARETYEWIQKCNEAMGVNTQQFMQYSSIYATMLTGFGVATADASKMALGYAELTYDVWAGYNDIYKTYEEAADAVKSAIAGEVEPIRKAGFTVIESTLEQTAANHGLKVSLAKATEAQKSYLRYLTLVDQAHKQSLVGTYAQELDTAEGLTRTLSMQVKSLAQAFGSLLLPVLAKVVPYLQAFLEIAIEGIRYLGTMFGITLQEVDWSGYNTGVGSAVEGTEDLGKAIKEVKNATLGIDELNVISPQNASGATNGSKTGAGFDGLDVDSLWDESILDNVNSQVQDLRKELSGVESFLKGTLTYLVDHKDTLLGIGAVIAGLKLVSGIKKVKAGMEKLGLIKTTKTVKGLRTTLTGLGKALTVVSSAVIELVTIKDSVKALALESENVAAEVVTIGVAATGAGVAMYAALGPWGIALAAVVGLAGAVVGLKQASDELIRRYVDTTVFDNAGYKISDLSGLMKSLWSETDTVNSKIIGLSEKIEDNNTILAESQGSFETYQGYLNTTGTLTKEQAQKMKDAVSDFVDALEQNLEYDTQIIFEAFGKLSKDAAVNLGFDVTEMTNILVGFQKTFSDSTSELEKTAQGYFDRMMAGEVLDESEIADLNAKLKTLTAMSDQTFENQQKIKGAMANLENLNFEDVETATKTIEDVAALGQEMLDNADLAEAAALESVAKLEHQAKVLFEAGELDQTAYNQFNKTLEQYRLGITAAYDTERDSIKTDMETVFGYIGAQLNQAGLDVYEGAGEQWENLDWWGKLVPNKEDYELTCYERFLDEIGDPIFAALDTAAGKLELAGFNSGQSVANEFYDGLYTSIHIPTEDNPFYTEAVNAVEGYKKGIEDNTKIATDAFAELAQSGLDAVVATQDSHSPAVEYIKLAKDAVDGYALGVEQNIDSIETVWEIGLENIAQTISQKLNAVIENAAKVFSTDTWSGYAKNVTNALSKIKMPTLGSVELKVIYNTDVNADKKKIYEALDLPGWPKLKFAASGGVFDTGSLIWAGERGPEVMATAAGGKTGVMNVQQMQDAVYEGVYAAVSAAMRAGSGNGQQAVNVYLDGRQITATVEQRQHERGASIMGNQVYSY